MNEKTLLNFIKSETTEKVILLLSILIFLSSFFESINPIIFLDEPNWYRFTSGIIIFVISGIALILINQRMKSRFTISAKRKNKISLPDIDLEICVGDIQNVKEADDDKENDSMAIILPANTSLDEHCLNDRRSALGSFVLGKIPSQKEKFINELKTIKLDSKRDLMPIGSSFLLTETYSVKYKIIITCISEISSNEGVISFPENIPLCIKEVFKTASKNKIAHIITPVIGSGHGGMPVSEAIQTIILAASFYSKSYKKVNKLTILVHSSKKSTIASGLSIVFKK